MASNYHRGGSGNDIIVFPKPINYLILNIGSGSAFSISFDGGTNYITVPVGFHNFHVGLVSTVHINSSGGDWQLVAVQG